MLLRYINLLVHILVACKYVALFNALETCTSKGSRDNNTVEYINLFHCRVLSNFLHYIHTWNSTIFKKGSVQDWTVTIPCTQEAIIRFPLLTPSYVVRWLQNAGLQSCVGYSLVLDQCLYVYIVRERLNYVCMSSLTQGHYSPLHFAAKKGYSEVVDILLKHGAEPNVFDGVRSKVYNMYTTHVCCSKKSSAWGCTWSLLKHFGPFYLNSMTNMLF